MQDQGVDVHGIEAAIAQIQGARADFQATRRKMLLELFVGSFAAIIVALPLVWLAPQAKLFGNFGFILNFFLIPLMFNATAWVWWGMSALQPVSELRSFESRGGYLDYDLRYLYIEYDSLRYSLLRERRSERIVDMLTALEFFTLSVTLIFLVIATYRMW